MKNKTILASILLCLGLLVSGHTATIYESSNLGPTGIGAGVTVANQFLGGRFQVGSTATTTEIGGHFLGTGTFFGAIVRLTSLTDFPDSDVLNTPDVLGHVVMNFPSTSAVVTGNLSVVLDAGFYGVIFGSNFLGASGSGSAPTGSSDIGSPNYFFRGGGGGYSQNGFSSTHFFVNGEAGVLTETVPEPSSFIFLALGGVVLLRFKRA